MTEYEKYQLQWMINHGHSLNEIISEMLAMQTDGDKVVFDGDVADLFSEWEYSNGFGGEIWACEREWEECEAQADPPELSDALDECDTIILVGGLDAYDNSKKLYAENKEFRKKVAEKYNYYWNNYLADAGDARFECVVDALSFVYKEWENEGRVEEDDEQ